MNKQQSQRLSERTIEIGNNRIDSIALLDSCKELIIQHMGDDYKLRITGNNKLILTK